MPYPAKTNPNNILSAALELLERGGSASLTMRTLARNLNIQPSSLYRHYPDREALIHALAEEAIRRLQAALEKATANERPHEAVHALSLAYVAYAREHAALYHLITHPRPPEPARAGPGKDLWNYLLERVGAVTGNPDDTAATVALWSFLHGFVDLERSGLFGLSGPKGALEIGVHAMLIGLQQSRG